MRHNISQRTAQVVLCGFLLVAFLVVILMGAKVGFSILALVVGYLAGAGSAYLAAYLFRLVADGDLRGSRLFSAWFVSVALISISFTCVLVFAPPSWFYDLAGAFTYGIPLGFALTFWRVLLPLPERPAENVGARKGSVRFWLTMSSIVTGLLAALVLSVFVIEPLSRH